MLIHIMYSLHLSINTYKSFAVEAYFQIISCPSNFFKLFFNLFIFFSVEEKETQGPFFHRGEGGTGPGLTCKKPKDLSACESEERGRVEGVGVYAALMYHARRA